MLDFAACGSSGARVRANNLANRTLRELGFKTLEDARKYPPTACEVLGIEGAGRQTLFIIEELLGVKLDRDISSERIGDVLSASDIVKVISEYIPLAPAGKSFKALCPFHSENKSSFMVSPSAQKFHCFGCGVGGDAARFLMLKEKLSFNEAIIWLEQLRRENA